MEKIIRAKLDEIEACEAVRIVYACESGSRAWGFPSSDSDYDVRFLYIRHTDWYLSIDEKRDVIECPLQSGLDINGWDLKKALKLLRKSNPPLLEWLNSPIVYLEKYSVAQKMRDFSTRYFSPAACAYHYLHMARGNYREYLIGEEVWVKKYFYVLRPILAMKWIDQRRGVVPTDFNILVDQLVEEAKLKSEIENLLIAKRGGVELDRGPRIMAISEFIEQELQRWEVNVIPKDERVDVSDKLDGLFRESLVEVWHS